MTEPEGRQLVGHRGLTPAAVGALIPLMGDVGFEELGLVKALLKRFFSDDPWTAVDASALARAVGPSSRSDDRVRRRRLDDDLTLVAGWIDGVFVVDVEVDDAAPAETPEPRSGIDFGATFATGVVPEPTPNPRTIRFATARRPGDREGDGQGSRSYGRHDAGADPRIGAVFDVDTDIADVLVGPAFVAVSIARPGRWPELLEPVLRAVADGFGGAAADDEPDEDGTGEDEIAIDVRGVRSTAARPGRSPRPQTRLDRAWTELGSLDPSKPDDIGTIVAAARSVDQARRQVAARLLVDAHPDISGPVWNELVNDRSRGVRRATLDALVDAAREDLRPMLERALRDTDAWARWKALHGLVVLGAGASLAAIDALADDPDFRVRLEAANARRAAG